VYIRNFWQGPFTACVGSAKPYINVYIYTVFIRYFRQGHHKPYGHIQCIYYIRFWPTLTICHLHKGVLYQSRPILVSSLPQSVQGCRFCLQSANLSSPCEFVQSCTICTELPFLPAKCHLIFSLWIRTDPATHPDFLGAILGTGMGMHTKYFELALVVPKHFFWHASSYVSLHCSSHPASLLLLNTVRI
jgi:hypothetical protein